MPAKKKSLQEIFEQEDFIRLSSYKDPKSWKVMSKKERELLARLFVKKGEMQLKKKLKGKVLESFELANQAAPNNPEIYFAQAKAYASIENNPYSLKCADEAIGRAIKLKYNTPEAWHLWGNVLNRLGSYYQEIELLEEALKKFEKAYPLTQDSSYSQMGSLFWDWGLTWHRSGIQAGEAVDIKNAIEKFKLAEDHGVHGSTFWNDYGNSLMQMTILIGNPDFLSEAAILFQQAVEDDPHFFEAWGNLAFSLHGLYEFSGLEKIFRQAIIAFEQAVQLNPEIAVVWLRWGQLYLASGKRLRDVRRIDFSLGKFEEACRLAPNEPMILCFWAQALMHYGAMTEQIGPMQEAEEKIAQALEQEPDNPLFWNILGCCYVEMGRYFHECEYFEKGMEKFRFGLSLDKEDPLLWYGLALCHFSIGDIKDDVEIMKKAVGFCEQVLECGYAHNIQFWVDWGVALTRIGELTPDPMYLEEALDKFDKMVTQTMDHEPEGPILPEWLFHYGYLLDLLGSLYGNENYCQEAVEIFQKAYKMDSKSPMIQHGLAMACVHYGEVIGDIDPMQTGLALIEELAQKDPENDTIWCDWGVSLLHLAELTSDPLLPDKVEPLYASAEEKLRQSLALGNIHANYNLACAYSMMHQYDAALHYLERAKQVKDLPGKEELLEDEWLENLFPREEFLAFLKEL